jgi:hypothetical protein
MGAHGKEGVSEPPILVREPVPEPVPKVGSVTGIAVYPALVLLATVVAVHNSLFTSPG